MKIEHFVYNSESVIHHPTASWEELLELETNPSDTHWFNVEPDKNLDIVDTIAGYWNVHPLLVEDIHLTEDLPKFEIIDHILFVSAKMIWVKHGKIVSEHISFLLNGRSLLSIQNHIEGDTFQLIRQRLLQKSGRIHLKSADYLLCRLLTSIANNYHETIDSLGIKIDQLESELLLQNPKIGIGSILEVKKQWVELKKWIPPLIHVVQELKTEGKDFLQTENIAYLNEILDQLRNTLSNLEMHREVLKGLSDIYRENQSKNANDVMKTLTVVSTIFIPLTFLVGVYGMNFENMPELKTKYGYWVLWGCMFLVAGGMRFYFKRKRWW